MSAPAVAEGEVTLAAAEAPGDAATDELYTIHSVFNGEAERPAFDERVIADRRIAVRLYMTHLYGLIHPSTG